MSVLSEAFVYLSAAVIAVPVANRLGLGSVLGYLIAGILIGPALGIVGSETVDIQHFAEFGVVMMLFLVGLELQPAMLWQMRNRLLGLGGLQVGISAAVIMLAGLAMGWPWQSALAVGLSLALSSTAIVLQTMNEKGWMKSPGGQSAFSVLLFQDIAVIPILAVLPVLAIAHVSDVNHGAGHGQTLISGLPGWLQLVVTVLVIAAIVVAGRTVIRPVFRFIAESRLREIFTAAALLLVIAIALLMIEVGLSPALGTFLAGVVLSDSEYRHELESDIDPFKGLLLGLFFITVGAGVDFQLLASDPVLMVGLAVGLMAVKFGVLMLLALLFKLRLPDNWLFALSLCQAGEFGFVLFNFALHNGVIADDVQRIMILVVALSMLLTPVLFIVYEKLVLGLLDARSQSTNDDDITEQGTIVVAGVGRFGQMVCRFLMHAGHKVVVLDQDPHLISLVRKFDFKAFYGDASRPDLLHAAGISEARVFVAATNDRERQIQLVQHIVERYPQCRIVARALDRTHVYELRSAGAHHVVREVFESSVLAGEKALVELGAHPRRAYELGRAFRAHDEETLVQLQQHFVDGKRSETYLDVVRERRKMIEDVMRQDLAEQNDQTSRNWAPPEYDQDGNIA